MQKEISQPTVWPDYLDELWAKSPEPGQTIGESLAMHTWLVLSRFADVVHLRPQLPKQVDCPALWHILYWACFLHDFGKAASGFQNVLRGGAKWGHRHEVLSLAFLDWLFPPEPANETRLWIAAAMVSHHRDAEEIRTLYPETSDPADDPLRPLLQQISVEVLCGLWRWLEECVSPWQRALHLENCGIEFPSLVAPDAAVPLFYQHGVENVRHTLRRYHRFVRQLESSDDWRQIIGTLLLRGSIIQADHTASAHLRHLPKLELQSPDALRQSCGIGADQLHPHQQQCLQAEQSTILIAPTGSGKTESALFWAAAVAREQNDMPRLFYVLPFQASMNAMSLRLESSFPKMVGLQHSRSVLAVYRQLLEREYTPQAAAKAALWSKNLARLNYFPVRVLSPYQILKACYRLKGYEALWQDYFNAAFIFDEIHAYEPERLAMILGLMRFLREHFAAKFFVMSATLPSLLKTRLEQALAGVATISASAATFEKFRRHHLGLLEGEALDPIWLDRIAQHGREGMSVLACCNTVKRAQQVYREMRQRLAGAGVDVVLLHGRFNGRDRLRKENLVRLATGSKSEQRCPIVLVATQVIEVSLDIDLDVLYSDPAPLEALIQRFGRINRRRLRASADVFVFREPNDGQRIYDAELIQRGLAILDRHNDLPIDEEQISDWLTLFGAVLFSTVVAIATAATAAARSSRAP